MARAAGVEGVRVEKATELGEAIEQAIRADRPYLIDASIAGDANPGGAGVWELPGLGHRPPAIGGRHLA
jgi:acetolactate synthase-1/2/3 large subunit